MKDAILGVVRHILTAAGGSLVTAGYIGDADLQAAIGAVLTLVGIVLSIINKRKTATA